MTVPRGRFDLFQTPVIRLPDEVRVQKFWFLYATARPPRLEPPSQRGRAKVIG